MPTPFYPCTSRSRRLFHIALAGNLIMASHFAQAFDYGIYDARGLAMGGTTVALGDTAQAPYYNPALLSFHDGDEDKTRDGRFYFPTVVVQASNTLESVVNAVDDKLDTQLSNALNAFNAQINPTNAAAVLNSASDLRKVLDKLANKDITIDGFIGLSVSEPSDREGGAFYLGARVVGVGTSNVSKEDLALLNEYIDAMDKIAGGANTVAVALSHPNVATVTGNSASFKDPTNILNSSANVAALAIAEWGVSLAKEFTLWGQPVSLGITPKMMRVEAYRDDANFNNTKTTTINDTITQFSNTRSTSVTFNTDLGAAATVFDHYRIGLAIKDAIPKAFVTQQSDDPITGLPRPDLSVKLHPRSRLGLGYVNDRLSLGLDYDLKKSVPIANESPTQNISLGGEYKVLKSLALRLGYTSDQTGVRGNSTAAGIGYHWRRLVVDASYISGGDTQGLALQMGWAF